jgi:glutathione S-transferase
MYTLYVIPGSHACRSAMLMLKHKRVPHRRVDILTLTHPVVVRLLGFDAGGQTRTAGGRRSPGLRMGDRFGTVPALAAGKERISTNHGIARFLDSHHPDQPLFPADPAKRAAVEEVERWANEELQMTARRLALAYAVRDPEEMTRRGRDGRMGYMLYKSDRVRRRIVPMLGRQVFAATPRTDGDLLAELPALLDRVDAAIAEGVLGGSDLNAADFMVAPSLALILYRPELVPMFAGRRALELVDRLLPEPA